MNPSHDSTNPTSDAVSEKARYWNGVSERDRKHIEGITIQLRHHLRSKNLNSLQIGQLLLRAKAKIKHGYFSDWLEIEFGGIRTAQRDMREAKLYAGKFEIVAILPRHLIHQLSQKTVPEELRAEVIRRCEKASANDVAGIVAYARAKIPGCGSQPEASAELREPLSYDIERVRRLTITLDAINSTDASMIIAGLKSLGLRVLAQQLTRNVAKSSVIVEHALYVDDC